MNYIAEDMAFEEWCENNYLPILSQAMWKKLFKRFNRSGWSEWVTVDNLTLMADVQIKNEKTFIGYRDRLIEAGLIQYIKGRKGSPNKYRLVPFSEYTGKNPVHSTVNSTVNPTVYPTVNPTDITKRKLNIVTYSSCSNSAREDGTAEPDGVAAKEIPCSEAVVYYLNRINPAASPVSVDLLGHYAEQMTDAVCIRAMDIALDEGKMNWSYVQGILKKWTNAGVKCLADVARIDAEYRMRKGKMSVGQREQSAGDTETRGITEFKFHNALDEIDDNGYSIE